mgnify:CR=1 FL=1
MPTTPYFRRLYAAAWSLGICLILVSQAAAQVTSGGVQALTATELLAQRPASPVKQQDDVPTFRDEAIVGVSSEPVTLQEIEAALPNRAAQHELAATVADRGIAFQYTPDLGRTWRSQGATAELLAAVAIATVSLPSLPEDFSIVEVARANDYNESSSKGRLDIRLHVDDAVEVRVQGNRVIWKRLAGAEGSNAGTETTQPFPMAPLRSLNVVKRDGRGQFIVLQKPSDSNGYEMRIRIYDPKGGSDRYHLRIDWEQSN